MHQNFKQACCVPLKPSSGKGFSDTTLEIIVTHCMGHGLRQNTQKKAHHGFPCAATIGKCDNSQYAKREDRNVQIKAYAKPHPINRDDTPTTPSPRCFPVERTFSASSIPVVSKLYGSAIKKPPNKE